MFTGKGGVGKTTVSCATALSLAAQGRKVLLVSTDPASNVAQVFEQPFGSEIIALGDVVARDTGMEVELDAIEIDPNMEAEKYRESILAPVRHLLPPEVLRESEETLSGSCTVEVASFNRFVDFLVSPNIVDVYDHIVFDTAPTGHTLRLLALPGDWSSFIEKGTGDASCLGPLSGLDKHRQTYDDAVNTLKDPALTTLVLVARAQDSTLQEAERAASELSELGVNPQALVVNALLPEAGNDPLHRRLMLGERSVLNGLATTHPALSGLACFTIPMNPEPVMGIKGLTTVAPQSHESVTGLEELSSAEVVDVNEAVQSALSQATEMIVEGGPKVVLAMGKGGVGKRRPSRRLLPSLSPARGCLCFWRPLTRPHTWM
ncbi:TRC40/GET3/ArsA family transport-energizing ATPase [Corynebacterium pyruviciproducens]